MQNLKDNLRQRLSQKKMANISIGALAIESIDKYFNKKHEISGYIRHSTLFLKLNSQSDKTEFFIKKKILLDLINKNIKNIGYNKTINNIIIK